MGLRRLYRDPPDASLPLSRDRATRLRRLVARDFERRRFEVVVEGDAARDYSGTTYGLWSLAVVARDRPESHWPALVASHLDRLLGLRPGWGDMTAEQLRRTVHLQLRPLAGVVDPAEHPGTELVAEDLVAMLTVAGPRGVEVPRESVWRDRGGLERWEAVARRNLHTLISTVEHTEVRTDAVAYSVVEGRSAFTASLALVLPELMSTFTAETDRGCGVLVIVPTHHQLRWRVVDGHGAADTLNDLAAAARDLHDAATAPLSPHVYWVRRRGWSMVTGTGRETVWPELRRVLSAESA